MVSERTRADQRTGMTERGSALPLALFLVVITSGLSMSTLTYIAAERKKSETDFALQGQAVQLARSGLTEALNWFRRQPAQPVAEFAPQLDAAADPAVMDTDDPDIGLVRDFRINGTLWGRYEVWRHWAGDPDADRLVRREDLETADVSTTRGDLAGGSTWRLRAVGYVYVRADADLPFDTLPNRVRASAQLESEIHRLSIALPSVAALCVGDGNRVTINTNGRVDGGTEGAGIAYPQGSGTPHRGRARDNRVTGTPELAPTPDYDDSMATVFGMTFDQLEGMADFVVTRNEDFPNPVPAGSLVVVDVPSLHFDSGAPLRGAGIVVARGNLMINQNSNSSFSGVLYVDGNLQVRQPSELRGSVIVTGTCTVQGSSDYATLIYDSEAVSAMQESLSRYRVSGPLRPVLGDR